MSNTNDLPTVFRATDRATAKERATDPLTLKYIKYLESIARHAHSYRSTVDNVNNDVESEWDLRDALALVDDMKEN